MTIDSDPKPLLIYDGDCEFCSYWADYWQKLTGDKVSYATYQAVGKNYPEISAAEFQKAIQYIAPDGKRASAAKASYLTLSHAPGKSFWLTLYKRLPGFAFITEMAYALIAKHRGFFYTVSKLLWGKQHQPPGYDLVSWLFLRGLGLLFLIAFISFGTQASGLIGSDGIIPVGAVCQAVHSQLGAMSYWVLPMVFWLNSSDVMVQAVCWGGTAVSLLLVFGILPRLSLILLYVLYISLCSAGQFFMSFQWDMFLLEAGILALFLYGWTRPTGIWLLRWLQFRFILGAGLVKILSGDPAWRQLTALSIYFETEPLPTPLAWYAAQLSSSLLKFGTAAALFVELIMPFLIFFPRRLRFLAAFGILFMQILILLTGNYNFFNLQTMLLCIVLFDDAAIRRFFPKKLLAWVPQSKTTLKPHKIGSYLLGIFVVVTVSVSLLGAYLRFIGQAPIPLEVAYNAVAPLRIVNNYGPFAVITTKRNEIIFEGSNDKTTWLEYHFKYKPGDVNRPLKWNIPFQPRLDWQMWFAALGTLNDNRWLLNVAQRLLENAPPVIGLLESTPFPDKPPTYLRAQFYEYHFTDTKTRKATGAIWQREFVGSYIPEVNLNNPGSNTTAPP
jgi:predicted DCC family thiol-disulfide oxidoreductase YuxK